MGLIKWFRNLFNRTTLTQKDEELLEWLGIDSKTKRVNEVTYFTCLKMLSETLGKMPLKYYQDTGRGKIRAEPDDMTLLLTTRPNPVMTPTTLWSAAELNCQHYGNAYIWIQRHLNLQRYGGAVVNDGLWLLPSNDVQILIDNEGVFQEKGKLYYQYTDAKTGELYVFPQEDVLHFKTSYSFDGILGVPVQEMIGNVVDSALSGQDYVGNLYKQGLTGPMALEYMENLDPVRRKKLQARYQEYLKGARESGQVIPVPQGLKLTPLKLSLSESQFYELKKYSALQIAAAFGIKPNQINDYDKSSYSNAEMQQLAFLVETMMYRIKGYEEEINYKVLSDRQIQDGYWYRFNEKALLRTDSATQMQTLTSGVNNGIYTPNEARELLMLPWAEGGDQLIVNGNYIPITQVGAAYDANSKGGEDG